jgi:hypothetical protein
MSQAQILRIVLLGPEICGKCNSFKRDAERKGLVCEKRIFDEKNPEHARILEEAKASNGKIKVEAPLVCLENAEGGLSLICAGYAMMTINDLVAHEKQLQAALVSA